jgi:hypothetical protein
MGYYVYAYLDSKMRPYYIGKGSGKRWQQKHYCPIPKDTNRIPILFETNDEDEAYDVEEQLIEEYWSIIVNKLPGGKGHMPEMTRLGNEANRGKKRTPEQRKRMSEGQMNTPNHSTRGKKRPEFAKKVAGKNNPMYDKKHTPAALEKIHNIVMNRPMISCVKCGMEMKANSIGLHWKAKHEQ